MINETYFSVMFHKTRLPEFPATLLFSLLSFSRSLSLSAGWRRFQRVIMMGSRTGSLCPCPPPMTTGSRWQACLLPLTTSSASCLKIKWVPDPSVKSSLHGPWVSTIPQFPLNHNSNRWLQVGKKKKFPPLHYFFYYQWAMHKHSYSRLFIFSWCWLSFSPVETLQAADYISCS